MKRLIRSAVEMDNMGIPPMVTQKAPTGYKDFEEFIEKATDEEIENYVGSMDAEELKQMEREKFKDEKYW